MFGALWQGVSKGLAMSGRRRSGKYIAKHSRNVLPDCVSLFFLVCIVIETTRKNIRSLIVFRPPFYYRFFFYVIGALIADVVISSARA